MPPTGLLQPRPSGGGPLRRRVTLPACAALVLIAGTLAGLWAALHYIQTHLTTKPALVLLFPPLAMGSIALVIPLCMFLSFQDDFRGLNPVHPLHFAAIAKRCYGALARNNMRVAEKDL